MKVIEYTTTIAASPEAVFRVIADPRSKPLWVPGVREVKLESNGALGSGTKYVTVTRAGPIRFTFDERIVEWTENQRVAYEGRAVWGYFITRVDIQAEGDRTRMHYTMDYAFPAGWLGAAVGRTLTFFWRRLVESRVSRRFKQVVEEGLWKPVPK